MKGQGAQGNMAIIFDLKWLPDSLEFMSQA